MLPSSRKLDIQRREAFTDGYVEVAVDSAAGGTELSPEVTNDLDRIKQSVEDDRVDLNENGECLSQALSKGELQMLGKITALQSQNQE
ncbi:MAG TPA: hypothetical protein VNG32_03105 [Candidatus Dormibacteraeota bacterium]|nr:hypothetical protein [Candidatus Dormibacteraeota bacterium]